MVEKLAITFGILVLIAVIVAAAASGGAFEVLVSIAASWYLGEKFTEVLIDLWGRK